MKKKRNKRSGAAARKSVQAAPRSPEAREREALAALEHRRWRDAIGALKALLKEDAASERTSARRLALANAYAGRAHELSEKGMLKEALAIWDNRAALGPEVPPAPEYAALKLRLGDPEPLLALWSRADTLSRGEREPLGTRLAAVVLAGDVSLLQRLADDDPLRRHAEPARAALAAYCAGDDAALENALAAIPFRSPYRDFALLLKALSRLEVEPQTSRALLARIGDDSAFAPFRRAAEAALLSDAELLAALRRLGPHQAELVAALRGFSAEQLALARDLAALDVPLHAPVGPESAARQPLLRLLQRHRDLLGADWLRRAVERLAPSPPGQRWPGRGRRVALPPGRSVLGEALSEARQAEAEHHPWVALDVWGDVAEILMDRAQAQPADPDRRLAVALALRRADQYLDLLAADVPDSDPESDESYAAGQLERSLQWDPEHRETYLRLVVWYRRGGRLKDARRVLKAAQERWPRDMAVLEAALETALAGDAFKKAAGVARQMLDIDPINSGARRRLVDAHISHAAKQVAQGRADLAAKELQQARQWTERGVGLDSVRERLDLLDALLYLQMWGVEAGRARLLDLVAQRGPGLVGQLELALAADLLGLNQHHLAQLLELAKGKIRDQAELSLILAKLRGHLEHRNRYTPSLPQRVAALLKGAPWKSVGAEQLESACETFQRIRMHDTRKEAAGAALKRWPRTPVFVYHALDSKYVQGGTPSAAERMMLEQALERAEREGDTRMASRLIALRQQLWPFVGMPPLPFGAPWDDDLPDDEDLPVGPFDPDAAAAARRLLDLLEAGDFKQALEAAELPKPLRKQLLKLARDEGGAMVVELFKAMLQDAAESLDDGRGAPTGSRNRRNPGDAPPEQLDLF